ncbi:uncharacterized protein EI90DRAFT_3046044 [Cantharellus anzutake]|uniref:uncharacterized protein n=1 Tax=Cantharellus anzutake TaxID=1750568 RepID=UPI0019052B23|nr:uncharacterized protein EI90DRAFT_3046044 [Cantharellus anzutake]KAF8336521.1 hypothetical protein EI90DRAFT_3046044 [Cantharellus anzutake]
MVSVSKFLAARVPMAIELQSHTQNTEECCCCALAIGQFTRAAGNICFIPIYPNSSLLHSSLLCKRSIIM